MLKYILGGVALAVTGYGVKKYLEDEDNCRKAEDAVDEWLNKAEKGTEMLFDYANEKIDELDVMLNGKTENFDEKDEICDEIKKCDVSTIQDENSTQTSYWYNPLSWTREDNKENEDLTTQDEKTTQIKSWNKSSDWI